MNDDGQAHDLHITDGVTLHAFELADGTESVCVVNGTNGKEELKATVTRNGGRIDIQAEGTKPWKLLLRGIRQVGLVEGAEAAVTELGVLLTPQAGVKQMSLQL